MSKNFETPEIRVTLLSTTDNAGSSGGNNELPFIPFSNNDDDELGFIIF